MIAPAEYVRTIRRGESVKELVQETKALAWVSNAEHAVVRLVSGERIIIRGGPTGIEFSLNPEETQVYMTRKGNLVQVKRIYFHTHPRVTGPSDGDLKIMRILRQSRSYIFEIGGDPQGTLVRPK
jgi:hypothetical protein